MNIIQVRRTGTILNPDRTRVLIRPFNITSEQRAVNICARVMSLSEEEARVQVEQVLAEFGELHLTSPFSRRVTEELGVQFTLDELRKKINAVLRQVRATDPESERVAAGMLLLAESNYEVQFPPNSRVSERVIFPTSPTQTNGIEDARFVRFENEDGSKVYYATYTAYDGKLILPQLLETPNFLEFQFLTLNGPAVQNKGMALFPRKINGLYAMLSRQDNENIYLMYSDNIHCWYSPEL